MMIFGVVMSGAILKSCGGMLRFLKLCSMITALGMLVRSLAFNYWILFLGFAIDGFGYGCIFLAIRYYAFRLKDNMDVINSLVYINGGAFAGQCMGTILGGILAGQIEYRAVYMMATIILIVPLFILEKIELHGKPQIGNIKVIFGVLRNRSAMCFSSMLRALK
jgi:predicted MFS family arabinose efflux permease